MATRIHSTAVIQDGAQLGVDVEIGPYAFVGPQVQVGDRTSIGPQVVIDGVTVLGEENRIVGQASLGNPPQDLSYKGEPTRLEIGDRNTIREFVTFNRGTVKGGGLTRVGNDNLFMACCHLAHDCEIEDNVILGNGVLLAGHVRVENRANISGMAGAVAFVTIGAYAYVGAMTRMHRDVPPYMIVEGHDSRVRGVNVIGLERAGINGEDSEALRGAYRRIFRSGAPRRQILDELAKAPQDNPYVTNLIQSMQRTEIGYKGRYRESLREDFTRL
ncbi:MAG: acyl-ACP--UDP-N-acetylglucosamine O-acyltransferase, partial [Planctomycetota bacterium]|nr:acyl-ACP--UDP-N-acetylglucosamine O-acyltransferase [Planctomycetota bacterium]